MATILVDSNVLLDIVTQDPIWFSWSSETLRNLAETSRIVVNTVVYAEVSVGYTRIETFDAMLTSAGLDRDPIPYGAAFLAGKCFTDYRRRGGSKRSPLPDFFIGAHAAVAGYTLLTRDAARYRTYFPKLPLIAPS